MGAPVFIGDELTACGYRLAGARVHVVDASGIDEVFAQAAAGIDPVFLSASSARLVPPSRLQAALRRPQPLLLVVPDAVGVAPPDVIERVRITLGIE